MKNILGHRSWNRDEIIAILEKSHNFSSPNLPHYRYQRVKSVIYDLANMGYVRKTGRTENTINWVPTDFFWQWRNALKTGETTLQYDKYHKMLNPRKAKKKKCIECGTEFETLNYTQKFCGKLCKSKHQLAKKKEAA